MKVGENFYTTLKKNNIAVWVITLFCALISIGSLSFALYVYKQSNNNLFAINTQGELVPLKRLDEAKDKQIEAKANIEYFIKLYYNLNAYNMKENREKVFWLVGKQPTEIIKKRAQKGYFDAFLSIAGLNQNAQILYNTLNISTAEPYTAEVTVRIQRINGNVIENYNSLMKFKLERVNRNYPYNPYGLLITYFSEELIKLDDTQKQELEENIIQSENSVNQNPKVDE